MTVDHDNNEWCAAVCDGMIAAALNAGHFIKKERESFSYDKVEFKGAHNLVSYVDKTAERMIVSQLEQLIDGCGFITEEGTAGNNGQQYIWIIDPLDGTTNFVHGLAPYCVSIGLVENGEPLIGVIYEVTTGELFHAIKGRGAYLNDRKITVSGVDKLENALVAIGFSHSSFKEKSGYMQAVTRLQYETDGIRRIGSSAMDLAYLACGRFDAFTQMGLSPWDVAAGILIAREAGAIVSDRSGNGNCLFTRELVAAIPLIYQELLNIVNESV